MGRSYNGRLVSNKEEPATGMHLKAKLLNGGTSDRKRVHALYASLEDANEPVQKHTAGRWLPEGGARPEDPRAARDCCVCPFLRLLTLPLALPDGRLLPLVTKRVSCVSPLVVSLLYSCKLSTHVNTQRKRVLTSPARLQSHGTGGATAAASRPPGSLVTPGLPCMHPGWH